MATRKTTRKTTAAPKKTARKTLARKSVVKETVFSSQAIKSGSMSSDQVMQKVKNPKFLLGLGVIIILAALLFMFKSFFVVALVNGQPISRSAFSSALEKQDGKQVLDTLVTKVLIEQEANRRGISVSQAEIDAEVKNVQQSLSGQGQTLDQALSARGMTKADFLEQIRLQKLVQKMLGNKISVSDKEVTDYISANQSSLPQGATQQDTQNQVRQQLLQQKLSQQAQALVQNLQKQAKISYFVNL